MHQVRCFRRVGEHDAALFDFEDALYSSVEGKFI